jgi:hypothetical protein
MEDEHYSVMCRRDIDAKLSALVDGRSEQPGWSAAWRRLTTESTDEEFLSAYQSIRDSGVLPEDAGFHLVCWQIDLMTERLAETALRELESRLDAIRSAHGLAEDEDWLLAEAPPEYRAVNEEYDRATDDLFIRVLEAHGEHAIATLFQTDKEAFDQRDEAGREYFHGRIQLGPTDDAEWLDSILDEVTGCVSAESPMTNLSLLYREEEGFWEVDIFPEAVELVGGPNDGAVLNPLFSLDLEVLRSTFEKVVDFGWNAFGPHEGDGPFIWLEGLHQGRTVFLRILAEDPRDDAPRAKVPFG